MKTIKGKKQQSLDKGQVIYVNIQPEEIQFVAVDENGINLHLKNGLVIFKSIVKNNIVVQDLDKDGEQRIANSFDEFVNLVKS